MHYICCEKVFLLDWLTFYVNMTGWRIGWAIAPASIASAIRNIHIRVTDSAPAPFQEAALTALRFHPDYFRSLRQVGQKGPSLLIP